MPKLVVLNQGLSGKSCEIKPEKVTIGRVEDNAFVLAEQSVSSHHCEVFLRGTDVVIKDLESTNGTFINGDKISESVLKPGQALRIGSVELKLELEGAAVGGGSTSVPASKPAPSKALTQSVPKGVKLDELEGAAKPALGKNPAFTKKSNKVNVIFIVVGAILAIAIIVFIVLAVLKFGQIGEKQ